MSRRSSSQKRDSIFGLICDGGLLLHFVVWLFACLLCFALACWLLVLIFFCFGFDVFHFLEEEGT